MLPILIASPYAGYLVYHLVLKNPRNDWLWIGPFSGLLWFILSHCQNIMVLLFLSLFSFGFGISIIKTPSSRLTLERIACRKKRSRFRLHSALHQFGSTMGLAVSGLFLTNAHVNSLDSLLKANPEDSPFTPLEFPRGFSPILLCYESSGSAQTLAISICCSMAKTSFLEPSVLGFTGTAISAFVGFCIAWCRNADQPPINRSPEDPRP